MSISEDTANAQARDVTTNPTAPITNSRLRP